MLALRDVIGVASQILVIGQFHRFDRSRLPSLFIVHQTGVYFSEYFFRVKQFYDGNFSKREVEKPSKAQKAELT